MLKTTSEFRSKTGPYILRPKRLKLGDRVKTSNNNKGTVVRVDRDETGDFLVVRLDLSPLEFIYDFDELEVI